MSDIDDIKSEIAAISAKVDTLISVIPDEKLELVRNPDANLAKIDELTARQAEIGDISTTLKTLDQKLDNAISQAKSTGNGKSDYDRGFADGSALVGNQMAQNTQQGSDLNSGRGDFTFLGNGNNEPPPQPAPMPVPEPFKAGTPIKDAAPYVGNTGPVGNKDNGNEMQPNAKGSFVADHNDAAVNGPGGQKDAGTSTTQLQAQPPTDTKDVKARTLPNG